MAPLPKFRVSAMEELHRQVRFANRVALTRLIEAAETAATTLELDKGYSDHELAQLLTGFSVSGDLESAVTPGAAVLRDLSTLVERLCHDAGLTADDASVDALTAVDLMRRWSISRKTLDRYRTQGLIARRVHGASGRAELRFMPRVVDAFERLHPSLGVAASSFARISPKEQARIVRRAERYRRVFSCSLNQAAERLAKRFGRSHEGVRQLLQRHDEAERQRDNGDPIFAPRSRRDVRLRFAVLKESRLGTTPSRWGRRGENSSGRESELADLTRRQASHLLNTSRGRLLKRLDLNQPSSALFDRDDARSVLLAPDCVRGNSSDERESSVHARRGPAALMLWRDHVGKPFNADVEQTLSNAMLFLIATSREGITRLSVSAPSATALDRIETDLRWAQKLRVRLILSQLGVALNAVEGSANASRAKDRVGIDDIGVLDDRRAFDVIIAVGNVVDHHAPFHGGRLAASTSLAVTRLLAQWRRTPDSNGDGTPSANPKTIDLRRLGSSITWGVWLLPPPWLRDNLMSIEEPQRSIIAARYGLDRRAPMTRSEVSEAHDTTPQHIARLERLALRQAHEAAANVAM